jgi:hypothetical protein
MGSDLLDGGSDIAPLKAGPPGLPFGLSDKIVEFLHRRRRDNLKDHHIPLANDYKLSARLQSKALSYILRNHDLSLG